MRFEPTLIVALFLMADVTQAQTASDATVEDAGAVADPVADLSIIEGRLEDYPDLQGYWEMMRETVAQAAMPLDQFVLQSLGRLGQIEGDSIPYRVLGQVEEAERRASRYVGIIASDLDGDGTVTRDEIAAVLEFGQSQREGAAEALISFDADRNDALSPEEIIAAARSGAKSQQGQNTDELVVELLDLDADGVLMRAEIARVEAALKHAAGQ